MDDLRSNPKKELKPALARMAEVLAEIEAAARKLANKNFADIAAAARRRVVQLSEHPDANLVHEELQGKPPQEDEMHPGLPFGRAVFNAAGNPWQPGDGQQFDADAKPSPAADHTSHDAPASPFEPGKGDLQEPPAPQFGVAEQTG